MPQDLDLTYLDITPDDRDPQAIFDAALAAASAALPAWVPRNGNVEVVLMEALAIAVADAVYALNRLPPIVLEAILALYGIERSTGEQAIGQVTVDFDAVRSLVIPAGSGFEDPATGIALETAAETTVTSADTVIVDVIASEAGAAANAIAAGTSLDLVDLIAYATAATVTTAMTGGSDPEDDAAYYDRASTVLARVTSSLVIPAHFVAYLLEDTRIYRATVVDLYEPGGTPGSDLGYLTCYVHGRGAEVPALVRAELEAAMQERTAAMITVHCEAATIVAQAVDITVVALAGYSHVDVAADVEAALAAYLSTDTWEWGGDVIVNELIAIADAVIGVDYVDAVTTPSGTVTVADDELVTAGTITVTVT